ncbi:MAG: hypothetical protein QHH14_13730 [Clostridiales bacterium]|nr:hypothetical protein [Clostridiales bacterium]
MGREGHIVHCRGDEFLSEMEDGGAFTIKKGMTYVVSDELGLHRLVCGLGAKLLIIDGDFLRR